MGVPTVYHSGQASAPTLSGTTGSLVALVKACLVDGYGAKAGAGWTMPYVNGSSDIAVFQNSEGRVVRVTDDGVTDGVPDARWAQVVGAASASGFLDVDLVDPFPAPGARWAGWCKSATTDATARSWIIIADDKRFYFMPAMVDTTTGSGPDQGIEYKLFYFGKFTSLVPGDTAPYILNALEVANGASFPTSSSSTSACLLPKTAMNWDTTPSQPNGMYGGLMQSINGTVAAPFELFTHQGMITASVAGYGHPGTGNGLSPNPATGTIWVARQFFGDCINKTIRGGFTGAAELLHQATRHENQAGFVWAPTTFTLDLPWADGATVMQVPFFYWFSLVSNDTTSSSLIIDVSSDWDTIL